MRCLVAALSLLALIVPASGGSVIRLDRGIGPVSIGMSPAQVRAALGAPSRVDVGPVNVGAIARTFIYAQRKLNVEFVRGNRLYVYSVATRDRGDRTRNGIGVGSTPAAVWRDVAGVFCRVDKTGEGFCQRPREGGLGGTHFSVHRGRVSAITVFAPPF
jgi:hypothetical protein